MTKVKSVQAFLVSSSLLFFNINFVTNIFSTTFRQKNSFIPTTGSSVTNILNLNLSSRKHLDSKYPLDVLLHPKLGSAISSSEAYVYENKKIYRSHWVPSEPTRYKAFIEEIHETFTFQKFIDMPVKEIHTRKVAASEKMSFSLQMVNSSSESKSDTVEHGTKYYTEFSGNMNFSVGANISLDKIGLSGNKESNFGLKVGAEVYDKVTYTRTSTTSYSAVYYETFNFDNSKSSIDKYFALNYRQKFALYMTNVYHQNYTVKEWGSGAFKLDKHWDYTVSDIDGVQTYYFLIPIESPYFEVSHYYDNPYGYREICDKTYNSSIYFM